MNYSAEVRSVQRLPTFTERVTLRRMRERIQNRGVSEETHNFILNNGNNLQKGVSINSFSMIDKIARDTATPTKRPDSSTLALSYAIAEATGLLPQAIEEVNNKPDPDSMKLFLRGMFIEISNILRYPEDNRARDMALFVHAFRNVVNNQEGGSTLDLSDATNPEVVKLKEVFDNAENIIIARRLIVE